MASQKTILEMIRMFEPLMRRPLGTEEMKNLAESYFRSFRNVPDEKVKQMVYAYCDEEEYYPPSPKSLRKYLKDYEVDKHTKELIDNFTCKSCHEKVSGLLTEGICLDCAGLPSKASEPVQLPEADTSDFIIEGRRRCSKCGTVGQCIKEPREAGKWECQPCYAGMDMKQVSKRLNDIQLMMDSKRSGGDWRPGWGNQ